MKKVSVFFVVAMLFLSAHVAHAYSQVLIDEIMYDAPGADTGHEWVEIYNTGDTSLNLTLWKLFENDKNHGIKAYKGGDVLDTGAYAIIANNGDTFLVDHSGYTGSIFTSSFSLSNTGATIGLKDGSGNIIHQVSYAKDVGAAGDGNSLQKIDNVWHVAAPTPGVANTTTSTTLIPPPTTTALQQVTGAINVTGDLFVGETLTLTPQFTDPEPPGKLDWNFGDGNTLTDQTTQPVQHIYSFSGTYTVVLTDVNGQTSAQTIVTIADKPAITETIDVPVKEVPVIDAVKESIVPTDTATIAISTDTTVPVEVPLTAAAASSNIHLSDWLVGLAALIVVAVIGIRKFRKPKSEIVIPDDGIELID